MRILVIDDHMDTAHSLAFLLGDMGYQVEYAINGYAALTIAAKFRPHVIFLDMRLPDFKGWELVERLRRASGHPRIRVIGVSGAGSDEDQRRALAAGCDAYYLKPMNPQSLEEAIGQQTSRA